MASRTLRWRLALGLIASVLLAGTIVFSLVRQPRTSERGDASREAAARDFDELPPLAASPFRNTRAGVAYSGAGKCLACHPQEHESYDRTAHSQALARLEGARRDEIRPDKTDVNGAGLNGVEEAPDGEFEDRQSQRTYRIHREGDIIFHEESIRTVSGKKLVLADLPMRYVIGSGRFSRSYLVERDGFLYESPATWYAARPGWGLSPGYEHANQGFQRPVELRCLWCHAGRVAPVDRSPQRVAIHTQAIDCERCHGPGSLHVQQEEAPSRKPGAGPDDTIVNPARLDRGRREDLCAQCHFHGAATIELRGRDVLDFRPGQKLSDYLVHFGLKSPGQRMNVVGHVEQMRLSRCYQASDSLTCTTCHPPHEKPAAEDSLAFYRDKCLACHSDQACGLPQGKRREQDPADNCVACHMPRSPTEIPHFAFNHHRIGIHSSDQAPPPTGPGELIPLDDVIGLSRYDQDRNLGLAYLQFSNAPGQDKHGPFYRDRSLEILEQIARSNHDDVEVEAALARLYWRADSARTLEHAKAVAAASNASPDALATACFTLGSTLYDLDRPAEAQTWLERTVLLRPTADVWMMLSDCRGHAGDLKGSLQAARNAAEMAPDRPRYLERLVELLERSKRKDQRETEKAKIDREAVALKQRMHYLREYRTRVDQTPRNK